MWNTLKSLMPLWLKVYIDNRNKQLLLSKFAKQTPEWTSIFMVLDGILPSDYSNYNVKKGRSIHITTTYVNVNEYLRYLETYLQATKIDDYRSLRRRSVDPRVTTLVDWLVNDQGNIVNINRVRESISQKTKAIQHALSVADNQLGEYYQRNLINILHETYAVTEALLLARNSNAASKQKTNQGNK